MKAIIIGYSATILKMWLLYMVYIESGIYTASYFLLISVSLLFTSKALKRMTSTMIMLAEKQGYKK